MDRGAHGDPATPHRRARRRDVRPEHRGDREGPRADRHRGRRVGPDHRRHDHAGLRVSRDRLRAAEADRGDQGLGLRPLGRLLRFRLRPVGRRAVRRRGQPPQGTRNRCRRDEHDPRLPGPRDLRPLRRRRRGRAGRAVRRRGRGDHRFSSRHRRRGPVLASHARRR